MTEELIKLAAGLFASLFVIGLIALWLKLAVMLVKAIWSIA